MSNSRELMSTRVRYYSTHEELVEMRESSPKLLRMLLALQHNNVIFQIQKFICLILLKTKNETKEYERELFNNLIQLIDDNRTFIKDMENYRTFDLLFKTIDKSTILETSNFEKILNRFFSIIKTV